MEIGADWCSYIMSKTKIESLDAQNRAVIRQSEEWLDRIAEHIKAHSYKDLVTSEVEKGGKVTSDILRVAKKRDLEVHGIVDYVPPQKGPPKEIDINPRILNEHVRKEMKEHPKLSRGEAIEKVKDRIVPHWKRKKK
jgi:hypothetical protein